jgi:glycosyltransferase involved in cell wall biosynthesis
MIDQLYSLKLKILLITHYYPEHRGGIEIVAGNLAESLTKIGNLEINWMASNVDPPPIGIHRLHCLPMKASNIIEEKLHLPYPLWSLPSLGKLWREVQWADVIHLHDYLYMSNISAFLFAKIHHKPIVITQHIGFIPYKSAFFRKLLSFLNETIGIGMLKRASQTIFISEVVQKYFANKARFRRPTLMIPNGVNTAIFIPVKEEQRRQIRQELGLSLDATILLFVGRFVEKKGLSILQQLAKRLPFIQFVFAGWGSINPETWNLPNVKVFRDRRDTTLAPLYQAADLLILPSKGEGFPLVVQEAMACGTPVLVNSETVQANSAAQYLMFSEDLETGDIIEKWAVKIENLLQDSQMLTSIRPEVANFAHQHWSWSACAEEYHQIFQDLGEKC